MAFNGEPEWVEILEPQSRNYMYANTRTGECRWEPPNNGNYKRSHGNQWWQLQDATSNRAYYYNATTQQTVWERPAQGDVVALGNLQRNQEELQRGAADPRNRVQTEPARPASAAKTPSSPAPAPAAATTAAAAADNNNNRPQTMYAGSAAAAAAAASSPIATGPPASMVNRAGVPAPPVQPKPPRALSTVKLEQFGHNLTQQTVGVVFKKKVPLASMLAFTREPLRLPMLLTLRDTQRKEAIELFKLVQMYMGDRPNKHRTANACAHEIVAQCWAAKALRDELYLQLCKQTTSNPGPESVRRGWELLAIALAFFPPSQMFTSYLEGYLARHVDTDADGEHGLLVDTCLRRLERSARTGAKRGAVAPTLAEIEMAQYNLRNPSLFGSSIEENMAVQRDTHAALPIPWAPVVLARAVLQLKGAETEGIFRVPGDIDQVNRLKVDLDRGVPPGPELTDPHVAASALKFWFRDLADPLVPETLYPECLASADSPARSLALVARLPPLNRLLLLYIVRFLQTVGRPENTPRTKMTHDNLAMVWAPNFLRSTTDDPLTQLNNTKPEMKFVRNLIAELDTSEAAAI